jgi:hypothetical protein
MMIDGIELEERMMIVALGITTEGVKIPLGLWEGSTEKRDRRHGAAVGCGRAWAGSRAGDAVRDRRVESALNAVANFEFRASDRSGPRAAEKEWP